MLKRGEKSVGNCAETRQNYQKCENPPSSEVLTCPHLTQQPQIFALVTEAQQ